MISPTQLLIMISLLLFILGVATFITGVLILAFRTLDREVHTLAAQTSRLAQKGLADEIAGLVGNASTLLDGLNQMVKTATGIGVFLAILGLLMIAGSSWLTLQLFLAQP